MKTLNFNLLNRNKMKTIKGGIIVEHIMNYNNQTSEDSSKETSFTETETKNSKKEYSYDQKNVSQEWLTEVE